MLWAKAPWLFVSGATPYSTVIPAAGPLTPFVVYAPDAASPTLCIEGRAGDLPMAFWSESSLTILHSPAVNPSQGMPSDSPLPGLFVFPHVGRRACTTAIYLRCLRLKRTKICGELRLNAGGPCPHATTLPRPHYPTTQDLSTLVIPTTISVNETVEPKEPRRGIGTLHPPRVTA